jgi:Tc toxin complex TcA C-terminal TcB-binding domain/ABC toxin N-terminal region/Neuraminidase-like domain
MISGSSVRRVSSPLRPGDRGDQAANLHVVLRALVERGAVRAEVEPNRPTREELDKLLAEVDLERERGQWIYGEATRELVRIFQIQQGLGDNREGVVDDETAKTLNRELERLGLLEGAQAFVVAGTVRDARSLPVPGLTVRALDRDLRSSELLGESQTDPEGQYEIEYGSERFAAGEAGRADLQVVVVQDDEELARSEVRFNAAARETIDILLTDARPGLSEHERYVAQLEPLLDGVALADLREDSEHQDFSFLGAETGIPRDRLEMLSQAAREAGLTFDDGLTLPQEAFYAWFRYELPRERAVLLAAPPSVLARTLKRAIGERVIPARVARLLAELEDFLKTRRASELLRPASAEGPASLGDALSLASDHEALDSSQSSGLALLVAERTADDDTLARAAERLGVNEQQLRGVRRGLAMRMVSGGDAALMRSAEDMRPRLSDGFDAVPFTAIAAMTEDEWATAIAAVATGADAGEIRRRARDAVDRTAVLFPHDALLAPAARRPSVDELAKLVERASDDGSAEAVASLRALAGGYPGLRLDDVLDGEGDSQAKAAELDRRLGVLGGVYATNADVPFLELDYMPDGDAGTRLDLNGVDERDRPLVIDTFKAMRRVHEVTGLASDTRRLLQAGYGSAMRLAAAEPASLADKAGIERSAAEAYVAKAKAKASETALSFFAAHGATIDLGRTSAPFATVPVASFFTRIPGYSELFGDTAFCNCRHCQSVLSPAAYFVDLMWFVQRTLTGKAFAGRPATYPLRLRVRRPDLWDELELTCANTDTLVPYLDIVNEILEAHVGSALGATGAALGRPQVYRRLARTIGSVSLPFHLQLERAAAYLGHFARTRADVARALVTDETTYGRAWLGVSVTVWDLLVRPRAADTAFLARLYGPAVVQAVSAQTRLDVQDLLAATGWSRSTFGELLATAFVHGSDQPSIAAEKRDPTTSVQNDIERVGGVTAGVLDRLHRLWRLHVATGVAVPALDVVLRAVPAPAAGADETVRLLGLVRLLGAAHRLGAPLDAACALIGPIPTQPLDPGAPALFDRLFNLEPFVSQQGSWPQHMPPSFVHPSFASTGASTPDNRTLQRLLAGLQVSDAELVELLTMLGLASGSAPAVGLTRDVLALLFRHAMLARALDVSVADLGRLLRLARVGRVNIGTTASPAWVNRVTSLDDLQDLFAAVDDWRSLDISLDDAEFIVDGVATRPGHFQASTVAEAIAEQLERERPWELADTLLASFRGISEADSRQILRVNTARSAADDPALRPLETAPGSSMLRIRAEVDPHASGFTLALPAGFVLPTGVSASSLAGAVAGFDALSAAAQALATRLGVSPAKLAQLLRLSGPASSPSQPLESTRAAVVSAVYAGDATLLETALLTGRPSLVRLAVLLGADEWDAAAVEQVADDRAQAPPLGLLFDVARIDLSWRAVVEARLFESLAREPLDPDAGEDAPHPDRAALTRALTIGDWTSAANDGDLAAALAADRARIAGLRPNLPLASIARPLRRLERLRAALRLATLLGISGETLRTIVPAVAVTTGAGLTAAADAEYDALAQAADALYGVLRTVYPDATVFEERLAPFEDLMRGRRRDALVDFLLHPGDVALPLTFASVSELYGYFLLDVEMGGCARTSRIVAATQSVQLYVHRVLMSLEAGMWDSTPAGTREHAIRAVREQWDWRRHYRVWEANRRIFLFPESYLEPELRDDRTPLFDEIAAELLQQETTEANVTAAYTRYLAGLDELVGLRIAGVFREAAPNGQSTGDLLHIVAATSSDPPEHYYRTARNLWSQFSKPPGRPVFSAWEKMKVQIPARDVTPVVFRGRLHVFWLEAATRPVNELVGGSSKFVGYDHRVAAKFTALQPDGSWAPAQPLALFEAPGVVRQVLSDRLNVDIKESSRTVGSMTTTITTITKRPRLAESEGLMDSHMEPLDGYGLPGPVLPFVHIDVLQRTPDEQELRAGVAELVTDVDLFRREALARKFDFTAETTQVDEVLALSAGSSSELYSNRLTHDGFSVGATAVHTFVARTATQRRDPTKSWQVPLATVPARTRGLIVRQGLADPATTPTGWLGFDLVLELDRQPVLALVAGGAKQMVRLGSGLGSRLSQQLFDAHLPGLLSTAFQEHAVEPALSVNPISGRVTLPPTPPARGKLDVDGPVATYLREVWLELPYLVAGHLNAQQRFAAAQRWYHYLFDPTSDGAAGDPDRVWRYRGFRGITVQSLRDALISDAALDAYRFDPFNPHAIARLRPGSHKKAVVMRYIDNLLDWGDALFAEFTRESLNEATMLYVLAADILGPRPPNVGECGEGAVRPRTYATIEPHLGADSDFLIELELLARPKDGYLSAADQRAAIDKKLLSDDIAYVKRASFPVTAGPAAMTLSEAPGDAGLANGVSPTGGSLWRQAGGTPITTDSAPRFGATGPSIVGEGEGPRISTAGNPVNPPLEVTRGAGLELKPFGDDTIVPFDYRPHEGFREQFRPNFDKADPRLQGWKEPPVLGLAEQAATRVPVFCIPPNRELLAYWDRVADRLNKIRNCMDITGARREPSLFAPEIDPLLLARARAAGLSLDEVLSLGSGSVPPYRFTFLIERARQYAQSVQAFASALLAALEKKDAEELARLRNVHELNLLRLRTRTLEWEVAAAEDTTAALERQRDAVEYRRGYYASLRATQLSDFERTEQIARHTASLSHIVAATISFGSAVATAVPNAGSPFAMTYGGIQIGGTLGRIAGAFSSLAAAAEAVSASAGLEATFQRRSEEWQNQQKLAELELLNLDRQILASQIRADIARRSLEIHEKSIEQAEDVIDFEDAKFTSLGRFTLLAARLHRVHREAFNTALGVARMAERAFQFERGDDRAVALAGGYWEAGDAGLGAGDALLVDLQRLEQRYLETNLRTLEVEQSFSLATQAPRALLALRETGTCTFSIPETAFDLAYPGQYRRRIKAVRLSIPCVTGPYVNVPATLRLTRSYLRQGPRLGLIEFPLRHTTAIAASSAQADGGVFEFTFRDERFLPFEGAGAVSDWALQLPRTFRPFDYRTISDVILRIGYTAEFDEGLRADVEAAASGVADSLRQRLETDGLPLLLSLRQDAPDAWRSLLESPTGTEITMNIDARHLPGILADWLNGRSLPATARPGLSLSGASLALVTQGPSARSQPTPTLAASLGAAAVASLSFGTTPGPLGLYQSSLSGSARLEPSAPVTGGGAPTTEVPIKLRLDAAGNLAPDAGSTSSATIDAEKLRDIVFLVTVKLTSVSP